MMLPHGAEREIILTDRLWPQGLLKQRNRGALHFLVISLFISLKILESCFTLAYTKLRDFRSWVKNTGAETHHRTTDYNANQNKGTPTHGSCRCRFATEQAAAQSPQSRAETDEWRTATCPHPSRSAAGGDVSVLCPSQPTTRAADTGPSLFRVRSQEHETKPYHRGPGQRHDPNGEGLRRFYMSWSRTHPAAER